MIISFDINISNGNRGTVDMAVNTAKCKVSFSSGSRVLLLFHIFPLLLLHHHHHHHDHVTWCSCLSPFACMFSSLAAVQVSVRWSFFFFRYLPAAFLLNDLHGYFVLLLLLRHNISSQGWKRVRTCWTNNFSSWIPHIYINSHTYNKSAFNSNPRLSIE